VLNRPTPKLFLIVGLAWRTLSYIIIKKASKAVTLSKCPAEAILCQPPNAAG